LAQQCRLCGARLRQILADFGACPLANRYLQADALSAGEAFYPLRALVCSACLLVQLDTLVPPDVLYADYAYFSSYSDTLLAAAKAYVSMMIERLSLGPGDSVIEIASNDGYLLQHFAGSGIQVLGVEPAANVARVAEARGIPTVNRFFGVETTRDLIRSHARPRLIVANNVLAHVPRPHDFVEGVRLLLAPGGLVTLEFHHLLRLVGDCQFDAIYHEHLQYYSLAAVRQLLAAHGLAIVDVEALPFQNGSLRVYARHADDSAVDVSPRVAAVLAEETAAGLQRPETYRDFGVRMLVARLALQSFLVDARRAGSTVVGYGAAAKGAMLLHYCGIRSDLVEYVVDRSPHKQGARMPGSHVPIHDPARIMETKPDYLLILPWNLQDEIVTQMSAIRAWGGRFVLPLPALQILA
jgi:SAM-dependent methyltransferase